MKKTLVFSGGLCRRGRSALAVVDAGPGRGDEDQQDGERQSGPAPDRRPPDSCGGVQPPHGEQPQRDDSDGDHQEDDGRQHGLECHRRSTTSDRHSSVDATTATVSGTAGASPNQPVTARRLGRRLAAGLSRMGSRSPAELCCRADRARRIVRRTISRSKGRAPAFLAARCSALIWTPALLAMPLTGPRSAASVGPLPDRVIWPEPR